MKFGSSNDWHTLSRINRELLSSVVEQEVLYYKIALGETVSNIYGESPSKTFMNPVKLNCLIVRGDQVVTTDEFGPDINRDASFAFLRDDLVDVGVVPEEGDVVEWHKDFYEVNQRRENQLFVGRDNNYNLTTYGEEFGRSISIICDTHLTRREKVGLEPGL